MDTTKPLIFAVHPLPAGTPEIGSTALFKAAWDECVELRCTPFPVWHENYRRTWEGVDRYCLDAYDGECLVARAIVVKDRDIHVGECFAVHTQYVLPAYRNRGIARRFLRSAMRITSLHGASVLAYSHRQRSWCYTIEYIPLNRRINGKSDFEGG